MNLNPPHTDKSVSSDAYVAEPTLSRLTRVLFTQHNIVQTG